MGGIEERKRRWRARERQGGGWGVEREGGNRGRERGEVERVSLLSFPLKFSISSQPGCQAATIKATLLKTMR